MSPSHLFPNDTAMSQVTSNATLKPSATLLQAFSTHSWADTAMSQVASNATLKPSAIWLQTQAGWDWEEEVGSECKADDLTYCEDDVVNYVVSKYLVPRALDWTNPRIQRLEDAKYSPADRQWEMSLYENPLFKSERAAKNT